MRQTTASALGASIPIQRWSSVAARKWAEAFFARAERELGVLAVVAVGSAIRDVPESSDVDLVLIYEGRKPSTRPRPIDVDLRSYERSEVAGLLASGHDLLGWAVRLGRVVFERDGFWTELREHWRGRIPFPSSDLAKRRGRVALSHLHDLLATGDIEASAEQLITLLTHLARAKLLEARIFPASRAELPDQLRGIGEPALADRLSEALSRCRPASEILLALTPDELAEDRAAAHTPP